MIGYKLFLSRLEKINSSDRKKVLNNIFSLEILIYTFIEFDKTIIFKLYDGNIYYQFNFILENNNDNFDERLNIKIKDRIVVCDVLVENFELESTRKIKNENSFYKFIKILKEGDISYFDSFLEDDF